MHHEPEDILALRGLLGDLALVHARLCRATGHNSYRKAVTAAREAIDDWERDQHRRSIEEAGWSRKPGEKLVDDRTKSVSLPAWGGGLPTLGRKRR